MRLNAGGTEDKGKKREQFSAGVVFEKVLKIRWKCRLFEPIRGRPIYG